MNSPAEERKVALVKVPLSVGGSQWGEDLTKGPRHIQKNGKLDMLLRTRFDRYEEFLVRCNINPQPEGKESIQNLRDILRISKQVQRITKQLFDDGFFVILLGGEQTADLGFVAGAATSKQGRKGISATSEDGHLDCHTIETTNTGHVHGQTLAAHCGHGERHLVTFHGRKTPRLKPENVIVLGTDEMNKRFFTGQSTAFHDEQMYQRSEAYQREIQNAREWGIHTFPAHMLDDTKTAFLSYEPEWFLKFRMTLRDTLERTSGHIVLYDLDHLHQDVAPGVAMQNPEGISLQKSLTVLAEIKRQAKEKLMGVAIVEADPRKDVGNKTARAAIHAIDVLTLPMV